MTEAVIKEATEASVGKQMASWHKAGADSGLFLASQINYTAAELYLAKINYYGYELYFQVIPTLGRSVAFYGQLHFIPPH